LISLYIPWISTSYQRPTNIWCDFVDWPSPTSTGFFSCLLTALQNFHNSSTEEASTTTLMGQARAVRNTYIRFQQPTIFRARGDRNELGQGATDFLLSISCILAKITEFGATIVLPQGSSNMSATCSPATRRRPSLTLFGY
jgi:hypothetical protein